MYVVVGPGTLTCDVCTTVETTVSAGGVTNEVYVTAGSVIVDTIVSGGCVMISGGIV